MRKIGWFGVVRVTENSANQQNTRVHISAPQQLCLYLALFLRSARYWLKITNMNLPHLYLVPPLEFCRDLWH